MSNRDKKVAEAAAGKHQVSGCRVRGTRALTSRGELGRLFMALVVALATIMTSVPVTASAQQDANSSNDSALSVAFQNLEPTDDEVAAGFVFSRLDTRKVSVEGLPSGVYDLVLQGDANGNFSVHAVETGTRQVYADIAKPALVDTPTGKELNIALPGDDQGQDLRPGPRVCVTVTVIIMILGYPVQVSTTVCFDINIEQSRETR